MTDDTTRLFTTGSVIEGKWVLMEAIAKGGMGEVYRAHQLNLKRDVAIKFISAEQLVEIEEKPHAMESAFGRFQREVQVMAQVRHPNVLQIFDYGFVRMDGGDGALPIEYIVMEYVPGNTLRFTMSEEGFSGETGLLTDWLRRYFLPVLDGMQAVHAHGIVHRDIKPENILMDGDAPKIADFGLARSLKMRAVSNSWDVKGTWFYMAPEQFSDFRKAGFEADIYALGKILFEAVTGKLESGHIPFKSAALEAPQTRLLNSLNAIIKKATEEDKARRYQRIQDLRKDIEAALASTRQTGESGAGQASAGSHYGAWIAVAAIVFFLAAVSAYYWMFRGPVTLNRFGSPAPQTALPHQINRPLPPYASASTLTAADGGTMVKVDPGGGLKPFYASSTLVTFQQYLRFLNSVNGLQVVNGVVQYKGQIWIYLWEDIAGTNQIVFRNGHFYLPDAQWAPRPVVRVTWLGAQAYARHYGCSLPSYYQWTALKQHPEVKSLIKTKGVPASGEPEAVNNEDANPERAGAPFVEVDKEWLADPASPNSGDNPDEILSHVIQWSAGDNQEPPASLYPWEAFKDVGFRAIKSINKVENGR
jgi:eukaryotic-like serine/threonine-protein kinase